MAKIVLSELAPDEAVHFSLGNAEFDLGGKSGKKSFETADREVLGNAASHPWLSVETDPADELGGLFVPHGVPADQDVLSAQGPRAADAFDPAKVRAALEAQGAVTEEPQPVAIDAGLPQSEPIVEDGVAKTLAADETHEPAKSAANFKTGDAS